MENDGLSYTSDSFNFWRLTFATSTLHLLFVPPFWVSYFPFRPSLSQRTSGDLKPVPLGDDALVNFHFDFAVDPVDLRALFQC